MGFFDGTIGAIGQVVGGLINANVAKRNTDKTIEANMNLARYQYSKDLEMWNKGNAYNSPEAQMERLSKAGLNPNLVYGNGSVVGNTNGQLPKYNAPTVRYDYQPAIDVPAVIAAFQDMRVKNAQIDNLKAQKNAIDTNTAIKAIDLEWKPYNAEIDWQKNIRENDALKYKNALGSELYKTQLEYLRSNILKTQTETQARNLDAALKDQEFKFRSSGGKYFGPILQAMKLFLH